MFLVYTLAGILRIFEQIGNYMHDTFLFFDGIDTIAQSCSLQSLGERNSAWKEDVLHCGQWEQRQWGRHQCMGAATGSEQRIAICGDASSSLDVARALHKDQLLRVWDSVLVVSQSEGRGQLRRAWSSPVGNIYGALRIPLHGPYPDEMASVVVGFLFAEAFLQSGISVSLKWPNDLLLNGYKIGGILLEERGDALWAGVGLNVTSCPPVEELRDGWAIPAGYLLQEKSPASRHISPLRLWRTLVNHVFFCYQTQVVRYNIEKLTRRVQEHLAWVGREVTVHGAGLDNRLGRILGVNECGALRLLCSGQEHILYSGSVSLKP